MRPLVRQWFLRYDTKRVNNNTKYWENDIIKLFKTPIPIFNSFGYGSRRGLVGHMLLTLCFTF